MVDQIEFVSHHFGYKEEYVLDHTPEWIERKYIQAARNDHNKHRMDILTGFKSYTLLLDSLLNKGQNYNNILPPPFEEALKLKSQETKIQSQYVEGKWWSKK